MLMYGTFSTFTRKPMLQPSLLGGFRSLLSNDKVFSPNVLPATAEQQ